MVMFFWYTDLTDYIDGCIEKLFFTAKAAKNAKKIQKRFRTLIFGLDFIENESVNFFSWRPSRA